MDTDTNTPLVLELREPIPPSRLNNPLNIQYFDKLMIFKKC